MTAKTTTADMIKTRDSSDLEDQLAQLEAHGYNALGSGPRRVRNEIVNELKRRNLRIDNGELERDLAEAFRGMDSIALAIALERGLNFDRLAKNELANRGQGKDGEWVGFDEAKKIHTA